MLLDTVVLCAFLICLKCKGSSLIKYEAIEVEVSVPSERHIEPVREREGFMERYRSFFERWTGPWNSKVRDVVFDDVDLSPEQINRSLIAAAKECSVEKINLVLENGADPNFCEQGKNALLWATINKSYYCMEVLLKAGADPNEADLEGCTPLIFAARNYSVATLKLLLDHGANPNMADEDNETPLYSAVEYDSYDCVKCLLENGANPNIVNNFGETPLKCAEDDFYQDIAALLRAKGATR